MEKTTRSVAEDNTSIEADVGDGVSAAIRIKIQANPRWANEKTQDKVERLRRAKEKFLDELYSIFYKE